MRAGSCYAARSLQRGCGGSGRGARGPDVLTRRRAWPTHAPGPLARGRCWCCLVRRGTRGPTAVQDRRIAAGGLDSAGRSCGRAARLSSSPHYLRKVRGAAAGSIRSGQRAVTRGGAVSGGRTTAAGPSGGCSAQWRLDAGGRRGRINCVAARLCSTGAHRPPARVECSVLPCCEDEVRIGRMVRSAGGASLPRRCCDGCGSGDVPMADGPSNNGQHCNRSVCQLQTVANGLEMPFCHRGGARACGHSDFIMKAPAGSSGVGLAALCCSTPASFVFSSARVRHALPCSFRAGPESRVKARISRCGPGRGAPRRLRQVPL
jgi:hypothetical protein